MVEKTDVVACHPMGKKKENHAYIIGLASRQEGSAWHVITEGMRTGKNYSLQRQSVHQLPADKPEGPACHACEEGQVGHTYPQVP